MTYVADAGRGRARALPGSRPRLPRKDNQGTILTFAGSRGLPDQGWVWGSDLVEALLSLTRKDSQDTSRRF